MIALDTNAVIHAIGGRRPSVRQRLEAALVDDVPVAVPAIVLFELWSGVRRSDREDANALTLARFLELGIVRWPFDEEDAAEAGDIRAALARSGTPIDPYDVLIAAQARRRSAVLITDNAAEFARVPGLLTENWATG